MPNETPAQKPKKAKKPKKQNIFLRLLALLVTAALVLGAAALVVFRDKLNIDALRRWISYRNLETGDTGQAEPFTYAGGDKLSLAYLNSGVLLSSATGAHYYSFSGEQYAEEVLELENPILNANSTAGVVYNAGGDELFLFRDGEEALKLSPQGAASCPPGSAPAAGWRSPPSRVATRGRSPSTTARGRRSSGSACPPPSRWTPPCPPTTGRWRWSPSTSRGASLPARSSSTR